MKVRFRYSKNIIYDLDVPKSIPIGKENDMDLK